MNNFFNISRFGNYFCWDLRNAKNNYGLSLLICGCLPVIVYIVAELLSLIFGLGMDEMFIGIKTAVFGCAVAIVLLTFPVKQYGSLTDKRNGSDWLMIPASTFEKCLSMLLITCLVLPICLFALLCGTDLLLGAIAPNYGASLSLNAGYLLSKFNHSLVAANVSMHLGFASYLSWCENILIFTLGAIFFKKSKVAKTFIAVFFFAMAISSVFFAIFGNLDIDEILFESLDLEKAQFWFNFILNAIYLIIFAALDLGIYFRIKTLKH